MQTDGQIVELTFAMPERRVRLNDQDVSSITVSSASKGGMASVVVCAKDDRCWRSRQVTEERRCKVWKHFAGDRRLAHVNPRLCG
jgi:hypothetical protein